MGRGAYTTHGFRPAFKDWATETTSHSWDVIELALVHQVGDRVEAAYRRGDLLEKRCSLMQNWADYCLQQVEISIRTMPLHTNHIRK